MPLTSSAIYSHEPPDSFARFPSRRSTVHSTKGIVACTQPLAAAAGQRILSQGGNAADAAVAVAAALNMTEPTSTGIGGDLFCLFYDAKTRQVKSLNGSGRSPAKQDLAGLRQELGFKEGEAGEIPVRSVHAVTVPGAAAGWVDTIEKLGSGKLSMAEILAPAIELGDEGFPWERSVDILKNASPNGHEMLKDGIRAPRAGEIFTNKTLAHTFRLLAKHGKKGFYSGPVAEALVKVVSDLGGHITADDLLAHASAGTQETRAISLTFKGQHATEHGDPAGVCLWEHPPNGQGLVALMALGILEALEKDGRIPAFKPEEHNSTKHLHTVIEALRIAFADGNWWIADPDVAKVPATELISKPYLASRANLFSPDKTASLPIQHGNPAHSRSDTVYFAVTDSQGNGCSFINSNYAGVGTGIVPAGCGFTLQNRGSNFALQPPNHPNVYAPSKRPYHTIIPALTTNASDDSLHSVLGVMGGFMQPQGHVQVLLNMVCFGLSPQDALDAPRVCIGAGQPDQGSVTDATVYVEDGVSAETVEGLRGLGHEVEVVDGMGRGLFGRGQIIRCHVESGRVVWSAGSDMRGDGAAVAAI